MNFSFAGLYSYLPSWITILVDPQRSRETARAFLPRFTTAVPVGYGHHYAPVNYIDAWIEVTDPPNWTSDDTERLKQLFARQAVCAPV